MNAHNEQHTSHGAGDRPKVITCTECGGNGCMDCGHQGAVTSHGAVVK